MSDETTDLIEDALEGQRVAYAILGQIGKAALSLIRANSFVSLPYGFERDDTFYRGGIQFEAAHDINVEVLLNGLDLYEVSISKGDRKVETNGVYCDQLTKLLFAGYDEVRS